MTVTSMYSAGGPFGIGAGHYGMNMSGDGRARGTDSHPASLPEAPTLRDFGMAIMDAFGHGAGMALPGGAATSAAGMALGGLSSAFNGPGNARREAGLQEAQLMGLGQMPGAGVGKGGSAWGGSIMDAINDAFSGGGWSGGGGPMGIGAGAGM